MLLPRQGAAGLAGEWEEASSTGSEGAAPNQVSLLFSWSLIWGVNPSPALCW